MSNTIGQFDYDIIKMGKNEDLPFDPLLWIVLKQFGESEKSGMPMIGGSLASESEIDYHIQTLKDDLDAVAKKAKASLRRAIEEAKSYKSN